jgi:prepilin-type N-terminal cleavage/methylation domain-containing protein
MCKQHAFTLIELLVVIAVIALLLAILMPALTKAKELGQGAACKGNLKNYGLALFMYLCVHGGELVGRYKV